MKKRKSKIEDLLKRKLAHRGNYGGKRKKEDIKYIVIHYTANDGDHDEGNAAYFHRELVKCSAHYFVDDDSITQSVPDNYIAWSVGGRKYSNCWETGGGRFYGKCNNFNSINIELCDTIKNGKNGFTSATIKNAELFIRYLMNVYEIPNENVIRHFDVTGKLCPKPFVENHKEWKKFKKMLGSPYYRTTKRISLRSTPKIKGKCMVKIPDRKKVKVLEETTSRYWKVKLTLNNIVYKGYCNKKYLK